MIDNNSSSQIRVRVNVAVLKDNKILLVPHFLEDGSTIWYFPGGKVEFGEKLEKAAIREFKEETGFEVKVGKLIDIYETIEPEKPWHSIAITYDGSIIGGKIKIERHQKYGSKKAKWFSKDKLINIKYKPSRTVEKIFREI